MILEWKHTRNLRSLLLGGRSNTYPHVENLKDAITLDEADSASGSGKEPGMPTRVLERQPFDIAHCPAPPLVDRLDNCAVVTWTDPEYLFELFELMSAPRDEVY
jgi:hypothetical protein